MTMLFDPKKGESLKVSDGQLFIYCEDYNRAKVIAGDWKYQHPSARLEFRYVDGFIPGATFVFLIR